MVQWHWEGPNGVILLNKNTEVKASSINIILFEKLRFILLVAIMLCELIKLRKLH